jgi:hypothetical protein
MSRRHCPSLDVVCFYVAWENFLEVSTYSHLWRLSYWIISNLTSFPQLLPAFMTLFLIALTEIQLPDSLTAIGVGAFHGCTSLTSIQCPSSITSIGDWIFQLCSQLTNVELPNGITSIPRYAFTGCGSLATIHISDSVELPPTVPGLRRVGNNSHNGFGQIDWQLCFSSLQSFDSDQSSTFCDIDW